MSDRYMADISSNNVTFNADHYRAEGHLIIGIKATEGHNYINPEHAAWTHAAHDAGLAVLHYHFARPDEGMHPDHECARFMESIMPHFGPRDYAFLDVERESPEGAITTATWVRKFDRQWRNATHHRLGQYSNLDYITRHGVAGVVSSGAVWLAQYSTNPSPLPRGLKMWAWQFTDGIIGPGPHACAGIGHCDVSRINAATFNRLRISSRAARRA